MSWSRRVRPALFVLGAALLVGSLLGARALTNGHAKGNGEQPRSASTAPAGKLSGPIVLGTVDSEPSPVPYFLPPVLQSGTVVKVFVRAGQAVKVDDPLYEFDTSIQNAKLESARAAVATARAKVAEAQEGVKAHTKKVELAKQAVLFAVEKRDLTEKTYKQVRSNLERFWKGQHKADTKPYSDEEIAKKLEDDDRVLKTYSDYVVAFRDVAFKEKELAALEAAEPQVLVGVAEAGVEQARAAEREAQTAIDLCTVTAKTAGTVERVTIGEGSTIGISTREPALWMIPAGRRIVRAEVEAEFAHRVGKDLEGKEVVIFDNTDPRLTYRGRVRTVGDAFLLKRSAGDSLLGTDTRVLEAVVEILDPAPAGQPPLRVGQRVRVGLGQ
jgi:multidrug resistance efflux pump